MIPKTPVKKRAMRVTIAGLILLVVAYGLFAYSMPLPVLAPTVVLDTSASQSTNNFPWPANVTSEAALSVNNAGVLAVHGGQTALPTASTAKIMTALAILDQRPLHIGEQGPEITISAADVAAYQADLAAGDSVVPVVAGEQLSEYQALEALLLPSADNVADILANWAFGSASGYVTFVNNYALSLGMHDSYFSDASGLSSQTISTAADLVTLSSVAMTNPVFTQIVSLPKANLPVAGTVSNVNTLIGQHNIIGIKTGNTPQAGGCYVVASSETLDNMPVSIVGAIIGAKDLGAALAQGESLVQQAEKVISVSTIVHAGQVVGEYPTPWSGTYKAVAAQGIELATWAGEKPQYKVSLFSSKIPISNGSTVGKVSVILGQSEFSTYAISGQRFEAPSFWWRLTHPRL
ncbi:MAG TPA: hypothetical protein VGS28_02570 [Candidatus Saccharimonadales bacterium]|nr:hypothetical protein [Candidatus Saccharimonadales bacterium]